MYENVHDPGAYDVVLPDARDDYHGVRPHVVDGNRYGCVDRDWDFDMVPLVQKSLMDVIDF